MELNILNHLQIGYMNTIVDSGVSDSYLLTDLKQLDRWLCWQGQYEDGMRKKIPMNYNHDTEEWYRVSYKEPENWYTYSKAVQLLEDHGNPPDSDGVEGLQVVIEHRDDDFIIVDLDDCVTPETGEIKPWARKCIDDSGTYAEFSPSGEGLHLIFRGDIERQGWAGKEDEFDGEVYRKYIITVTGNHIAGTPFRAKRNQEFLDRLFEKNDIRWRNLLYETDETEYGAPSIA